MEEVTKPKKKRGRPRKIDIEAKYGKVYRCRIRGVRRPLARVRGVAECDAPLKLPRDYTIYGLSQDAFLLSLNLMRDNDIDVGDEIEIRVRKISTK